MLHRDQRAIEIAQYVIEHSCTVRHAAQHFPVSKSTVHKDLTSKLPKCSPELYSRVESILAYNKSQRHIRGGEATRRKYKEKQNET